MRSFARVFVDVDTQFDFLDPAGALYVPDGVGIHANLGRLTAHAESRGVPVLSSCCAHAEDDPEFQRFPRHCVLDTPGQLKLATTLLRKRTTVPADWPVPRPDTLLDRFGQVLLQKHDIDVFTNANLAVIVENIETPQWIVYGVATDYCVKAWAEGLLAHRQNVILVEDAIRAVNPSAGVRVMQDLIRRGAKTTTTDQAVQVRS